MVPASALDEGSAGPAIARPGAVPPDPAPFAGRRSPTHASAPPAEEEEPGGNDTQLQRPRGPSGVVRLRGLPFSAGLDSIRELFHEFELEEVFICNRNGGLGGSADQAVPGRLLCSLALQGRLACARTAWPCACCHALRSF